MSDNRREITLSLSTFVLLAALAASSCDQTKELKRIASAMERAYPEVTK